ncbi:hypothetical protein GW915_14300, partial [bacterium]|nr:hypothetical protein [bacterium]
NEYTDVTALAGTWTASTWDENVGGILTFACRRIFTPTATITGTGGNGAVNTISGTGSNSRSTGGFKGGYGYKKTSAGYSPLQGEGTSGTGAKSSAANGSGGGAPQGNDSNNGAAGAGGGNGTAGASCTTSGNSATGGGVAGDANLQTMVMGGGGGGGGRNDANNSQIAAGGAGGKIISIYARTLTTPTSIISAGGNGGASNNNADGGGGAGGSILICTNVINIGTNKISTAAGLKGGYGGNGGKGRIAIYYGSSLTGTISTSLYGSYKHELDPSLVEDTTITSGNYSFFM